MSPVHENFNESFDQSLRRLAVALPSEAPPAPLRTRVLGSLPAPRPARSQPPRLRLIAAGLAACAAAGLLVAGLHSGLRPASAAEVRAAILRANTWHFVGWHLRDGHKVRWEVWGRRSPALYREQIGDEVYLDDGTRSTHILPPDPKNGRTRGVVLILPSRPQKGPVSPGIGDSGANFLVGIGGDADRFSPRGLAGESETFEAKTEYNGVPTDIKETTTLIVDRSTHLPVRYVIRRLESLSKGEHDGTGTDYRILKKLREYTQAELTPAYDVPLPATVAAVQSPAGYVVTDANDAPPNLDAPVGSVATQGGLTVRADVVAQDAEGNLRLRFHAWLGSQPLSYRDTGLRLDGLRPGRYGSDDRGNAYIYIDCPGTIGNEDGGVDLWLVPAEPLVADAPPTALDLNADLGLSRYERMGQSGRDISVATEHMTFHLRLPVEKKDLGFDAVVADAGHHGMEYVGPLPSLANEAAEQRAMDCCNRPTWFVGGKIVRMAGTGPDYGRAAYWYEKAAQAAERTGDTQRAGWDRRDVAQMRRLEQQSAQP